MAKVRKGKSSGAAFGDAEEIRFCEEEEGEQW